MKKLISLIDIFSFVFGVQLGVLIAVVYIRNYHTIYKGPDSNDIKNDVYEWGNKYIKFSPVIKVGPVGAVHN